ncbi:MAG: hypothetical protein MI923_19495 [Phycisphaerales bacterium]|nr:hypothetical protein [Phycisphaerales bacterium]
MARPTKRSDLFKLYSPRFRKRLLAWMAAWPLFQATGCFPDFIGALNFELQSLVNTFLINTVSIVVQNLLGI